MLERLTIKDFQKHRKFVLDFDPRVTTLIGPSHAGKSAVLRALGLVCLSRWHPGYVRHGKKHVTVTLKADGRVVFRSKGKGHNVYSLDGKTFAAFASSVPEQIESFLNVGPENFQRQLDQHFWFSETPGQISRNLNAIVNLSAIDSALGKVASLVKRTKAEVDVTEERLRDAKREKKDLAWVTEFDAEFHRVKVEKDGLDSFASSVRSLERALAPATLLLSRARIASECTLDAKELTRARAQSDETSRRARKLNNLLKEVTTAKTLVETPEPDTTELFRVRKEGDRIAEEVRNLEIFLGELSRAEDKICGLAERLSEAEASLPEKVTLCPTCGQVVKPGSAYSLPTCTSPTGHRSAGPKKKTGTTSSSTVLKRYSTKPTDTSVPW